MCGWFVQGCCVSGLVMFLVSGWIIGFYHVLCGGALLGFEESVAVCGFGFSVVPLESSGCPCLCGGGWGVLGVCVLRTL